MTGRNYIVYKQRWFILAGVFICTFVRGCFPAIFAICNDMMTVYFRITPLQADMLTSADTVIAVIVCLGISVFGKKVGVRVLSLTTAICFAICSVATGIAITSRDLYALMLSGRLVSGISAALLYLLPPILANAWFPSDEVSTAAAIPIAAMCLGSLVSPLVYSNVLPKADIIQFANTTNSSSEIDVFDRLQKIFIVNMAIFAVLSLCSICMFCVYAMNHPPTPPSGAQAQLLKTGDYKQRFDLKQNFRTVLEILRTRTFWTVVVAVMINSASMAFSFYLQPSMLKATFESASNAVAGYSLVIGTITSACGSIAAGKVLDRWHEYKKFCCFALFLIGGCCVAIYFSHVYEILWIFIVFHAIVGFLRLGLYVSTVELLLEVTYPRDRTVAACLFFAFYNLSTFSWTPFERWVMVCFGEQYVAWVVIISQGISALILLIAKPKYKRTEANREKVGNGENTLLELELESKS